MVALDAKNAIHSWETSSGQKIQTTTTSAEAPLDYALSADQQLLAIRYKTGNLMLWNLENGSKLWQKSANTEEGILHFSKSNQSIFLRNLLGQVIEKFKVSDGSNSEEHNFFELSLTPDQYGINLLGQGKAIYSSGDNVQLVNFSRELSISFNN